MDDPNKHNHIFGNPDHNLDGLVRRYGSRDTAGRAITEAVNQAYQAVALIMDALGRYKQIFEVGGNLVTVSGRIVDGVARIGSAWLPGPPRENDDA